MSRTDKTQSVVDINIYFLLWRNVRDIELEQ